MKRKMPRAHGYIIHKDNGDFFKNLGQKQHEWMAVNSKPGRIFSFNGKFALLPKIGSMNPYDAGTSELIYYAQCLLDQSPPFYFDIERHSSGVDIIQLEPNKRYDCNVLAEVTDGGPPPAGGIYDAKASSLVISLMAYKICFDEAKKNGEKKMAETFAKRYTALLESQDKEPFFETVIFYFGDTI
jgi:hypothetical protein